MNKIAVYTAIFGGKDEIEDPRIIPTDCDFICFTDSDFISTVWQIKKTSQPLTDPVRSARMYKILAHKFLPQYETSVWIDGNMTVKGNMSQAINQYLSGVKMAVYNHAYTRLDPRNCLYDEADVLLKMSGLGKAKDNPETIKKQIAKYRFEKYPVDNGLVSSMVLFRRHNDVEVIKNMEDWWQELERHSRRDQLSFNYITWKNNMPFFYINEDSRENNYFSQRRHLFNYNKD